MPDYCSFMVFRRREIDLVQSICTTAGWSTRSIHDPSEKFRFTESGIAEICQPDYLDELGPLRAVEEHGRLLVLNENQGDAANIIQLICAANIILEGTAPQYRYPQQGFEIPCVPAERDEIFERVFRTEAFYGVFLHRETLPVAVAIAAAAWSNSSIIYAIHKLAQSYMTESVTPHSMHPRHGQTFAKHTSDFASHVGTSVAINLAYSAIQELGLDVRSSSRNPRWLDKREFIWNPSVLADLEDRLEESGIERDRTIDWMIRGEKSEVEVHPLRPTLAEYSDGETIRDRELSLPDAINSCEYLRNFMTAHAFSSSTPRLGPYEVYNTQQVARFLILSKCGLWNVWTEELRTRYG